MPNTAYGDVAIKRMACFKWHERFKDGRQSIEDDERLGRPSTSTDDPHVDKISTLVRANRRLSVREFAEDSRFLDAQLPLAVRNCGYSLTAGAHEPSVRNKNKSSIFAPERVWWLSNGILHYRKSCIRIATAKDILRKRNYRDVPFGTASGVEVLGITGPSVVVNGSTPLLVLDCEYNLTESDKEGLVVKWYYNRQPFPIYQWIPNNAPQDLGILKGRLLLDYAASDDVYNKHRALAIRNPTTELTGEYTCWLSSFASEDFRRKKLIVYAPARNITMTYVKSPQDSVIVSCRANGVSPKPEIAIFRSDVITPRVQLEGANVKTHQSDDSSFSVIIDMEIFDEDLHQDENMFECVLSIPDTDYEEHRMIIYSPGPPTTTSTTTTTTAPPPTTTVTIIEEDDEEDNDDEENGEHDENTNDNGDDDDDDNDDDDDHDEVVEDQPHVAESAERSIVASVSGSGKLTSFGSVGVSATLLLVFFFLR
ncbi:uncharacterized protein LOC143035573 [Oratosquilla oratoria]|uniref:uncharacterized protein LOC143035573 n=1 Tax=Oratosquilla oratoria TaxID=337810 RepID=UPI003F777F6C